MNQATTTPTTAAALPAGRPLRLLAGVAAAVLLTLVTLYADAGGPAETELLYSKAQRQLTVRATLTHHTPAPP